MSNFLPVNEPLLNGNEKKYLIECIDSGWISSEGPFVEKFEKGFSGFIGARYGVAVSSGTAAIETALYALGVSPGDEIILPSFTIISCAIACIRLGAKPVLVDIIPETWTMDVTRIESKITENTKVIMPVHMYGHPVEMDEIFRLKEKYDIKILEDAAQAHGAEYFSRYKENKWLKCGAMGDIAATSFYANKILTTGEGGMVLTSNEEFMHKAKSYRNLCFRPEKRFFHTDIGYNFRITNLQAAVGLAQLEQIYEFLKIKRKIGTYYRSRIDKIQGIRFQIEKPWARSVYWMYSIELLPKAGINAEILQFRLKGKKIGTRSFFMGLHAQPALHKLGFQFDLKEFPNTDHAYTYGCYLPSGLTLTNEKVDIICDALLEVLEKE